MVGAQPKEEKAPGARNPAAPILLHEFRVDQETLPAVLIGLAGAFLPTNVAEVVDQAPPVEIRERGTRHGLSVVSQTSRLQVETHLFFVGRIARRRSHPDLCHPGGASLRLVGLVGTIRG